MRILVIKWVSQDANMTSLLVMELAAAVGEFIHSFILNIYIAPLQENYSEALPTPARSNKAVWNLGLLANNGIVSLAWISIRPWLVNALSRVSKTSLFLLLLRVNRAMVTNGRIGIRQG